VSVTNPGGTSNTAPLASNVSTLPTPTPSPTPPPPTPTPSGVPAVGALGTYGGATYKCIQAHTSQVGWEPPNVPALWQRQ